MAASSQELLRLHDATVRRDGRVILQVDDFVLCEGEHIAVLGPNGAGKSTLIKLLTREVRPLWREEPPVLFKGDPRPPIQTINETIGIVSSSLEQRMMIDRSALDLVLGGFFGAIGMPRNLKADAEQVEQAHAALADLGIADLADRSMLTLSTGQARRVMVARSLIHAPQVLVFDEPCNGLDPEAMWHLRQTLSLLAQAGRTLILVTHDVADIVTEFDRVILLRDAHIIADGPKAELLTTERMRELFGVPVTLTQTEGHYHLY